MSENALDPECDAEYDDEYDSELKLVSSILTWLIIVILIIISTVMIGASLHKITNPLYQEQRIEEYNKTNSNDSEYNNNITNECVNKLNISNTSNTTTTTTTTTALPISSFVPYNNECNIFVEYHAIPPASTFFNGLFEHYFSGFGYNYSSTKCSKNEVDTVPLRAIKISIGLNNAIYIDVAREFCGDPNKYNDPMSNELYKDVIAYNYYNLNTYRNRKQFDDEIYLPLFFRYDFGNFERDIFPMIDNYKENTNIFNKRQYLISIIMSLATGNRKNYINIYNDILNSFGKEKVFLNLIKRWKYNNNDYKTKKTKNEIRYLNGENYRNILIDTKFNLCADGNNPETYRIWETLSMSTIPILSIKTNEYLQHFCKNSFYPFILHSNNNRKYNDDINIDPRFVEMNIVFNKNNYITNWYFYDKQNGFNVNKLNDLWINNKFAPFILLNDWNHSLNQQSILLSTSTSITSIDSDGNNDLLCSWNYDENKQQNEYYRQWNNLDLFYFCRKYYKKTFIKIIYS